MCGRRHSAAARRGVRRVYGYTSRAGLPRWRHDKQRSSPGRWIRHGRSCSRVLRRFLLGSPGSARRRRARRLPPGPQGLSDPGRKWLRVRSYRRPLPILMVHHEATSSYPTISDLASQGQKEQARSEASERALSASFGANPRPTAARTAAPSAPGRAWAGARAGTRFRPGPRSPCRHTYSSGSRAPPCPPSGRKA